MSLPLKPFTIDTTSGKQLDSKEKKFHSNINRALERFDLVTEWADYIASLGTLLKALQSWSPKFQNVKYYVPFPYQVSRRLTSSLSPDLPAGVHQKTLEVYKYIFDNIGLEALAQECNIWIPGILPLMTYASMSVKSTLIEVYDTFLVQLPSTTLKILIRPLLASLLPGIDDESSEFLPLTMKLIETLQENLDDDSLFWQTCFIIIITNKERRLGGLAWLTKKLPSLNAVPHLVMEMNKKLENNEEKDNEKNHNNNNDTNYTNKKRDKQQALSTLLPNAKVLVQPETGLLARCFISALESENDLLIKRGFLDLLLQRLHLNSPVLQSLLNENDKKMLIMSCCKTTLAKDMSLNRRVWNWLLGPSPSSQHGPSIDESDTKNDNKGTGNTTINESSKYFVKYGLSNLIDGLNELIKTKDGLIIAFKVCLVFMDRWEIGTHVVPQMFIPLLRAAQIFKDDDEQVLKSANTFFDAVETNIIWGKIFQFVLKKRELDFLEFILLNFHISNDEEIVIRHLPLILLAILSFYNNGQNKTQNDESQGKNNDSLFRDNIHNLITQLTEIIPERAFLPLSNSSLNIKDNIDAHQIIEQINNYYEEVSASSSVESDDSSSSESLYPFTTANLTFLIVYNINKMMLDDLNEGNGIYQTAKIFVNIFEKVPQHDDEKNGELPNWSVDELSRCTFNVIKDKDVCDEQDSVLGIVEIFSKYLSSRMTLIESIKLLNDIIKTLWKYMIIPKKQQASIKCLKSLQRTIPAKYIEAALSSAFVQEQDVSKRLLGLDLLWNQMGDHIDIIKQPIELILDELFDEQNPYYLSVSKWILSLLNSGSSNRLYQILTNQLATCDFLQKNEISTLDDLDMFTYRIQLLTNVLKTNGDLVVKNFSSELTPVQSLDNWRNDDVATYKNLTIVMLLKFLGLKNNSHAKSIRSSLILLDCLLDGTEHKFGDYVIFLLQMSSQYISDSGLDSELIAVSLLDIVPKVLRISHVNNIKLDIFDDDNSHLKFIDFMVTSISRIESTLVITSYVKLLSESITYFGNTVFDILLPLISSIIQCIQRFFQAEKEEGGYYQSISLLLGALEELIQVSHDNLSAEDRDGYFSNSANRGDFLQSVVSNVFYSENNESEGRNQGERDVVIQAFKQVIACSLDIWTWALGTSNKLSDKAVTQDKNYNAYKFKFRSKKLLETMFLLEPLEVLENLVIGHSNDNIVTLIHVLDGNKPALTIPYFFHSVIHRYNRATVIKFSVHRSSSKNFRQDSSLVHKLSGEKLMKFLINYANSLENSAVEEFSADFFVFFKEIVTNYSMYKVITNEFIEFTGIIAKKLQRSQFHDQKRFKREVSDLFGKYLPNAIPSSPMIGDTVDTELLGSMERLVPYIKYIVNEEVGGDKFNTIISTIVSQCLIPLTKSKNSDKELPDECLPLALEIAKVGSKVRVWKDFINDLFKDDKILSSFGNNPLWDKIIYEWSQYSEYKSKLLNDLLQMTGSKKMGMTPALITFSSWNDSETLLKYHNMKRIAFLVRIAPVDKYLLEFQSLVSCVCQYLVTNDIQLKSKCWILLRVLLLKFSVSHFNEYWGMISYCLQINLQEFYESLQIQRDIDSEMVLQICKTLDLLLLLNIEGFSATNEWLFIIDTINCVYKTYPYMSLVDKIFEFKDYTIGQVDDIELSESKDVRVPFLYGIHRIEHHSQLRNFFGSLSYSHYEGLFSMKPISIEACEEDVLQDIFA